MKFADVNATSQKLESIITAAVQDESASIPGMSFVVVSKDGSTLFEHSAGTRGVTSPEEPVTSDTIFWIASCTKMVTALCCMQLVEQGKLSLDDSDQLEALVPEMKDVRVLKEDGRTLEEKKKGITLRMLLTHTAGFGYTFFNEQLRDWSYPAGVDEFSGDVRDIKQPLVFQPGEGWEYGVSLDWAGVALERVTGLRLNDYMQKHIFEPLGIKDMNMIPTASMKERLAHLHQRQPDGKIRPTDHLHRRALQVETAEEKERLFHSGGAGLFAKPAEYAKIIAVLLNDGTCPITNTQILSKATVDTMFTNQIPHLPDFGRRGIPASKPTHTNPIPDLYPNGGGPQGWGLSFMLTGGPTGRAQGTGFWAGLSNLYWWADRERGVGGLVATQVLPFADLKVIGTWFQLEGVVYAGLEREID